MKKANVLLLAATAFFAGAFSGSIASSKEKSCCNKANTIFNNYGKDDNLLDETADLEALDGAE